MKSTHKTLKTLLAILILLLVFFAIWKIAFKDKIFISNPITNQPQNVEPTQNTLVQIPENWRTKLDIENNLSFRYPENLGTTYVTLVDWPPLAFVQDSPYSCVNAGEAIERAGKTEERNIDGRIYCVTEKEEGAAGSIYTSYAYNSVVNGKNLIFTFTIRKPQCMNYDEPNQSACIQEQQSVNFDRLADQMMQSVKY